MHAVIVIFTVFIGLSGFVAIAVLGVMLIAGRLTIPGTAEHRLNAKKVDLLIAEQDRLIEMKKAQTDLAVHQRHQLALTAGNKEGSEGENDPV